MFYNTMTIKLYNSIAPSKKELLKQQFTLRNFWRRNTPMFGYSLVFIYRKEEKTFFGYDFDASENQLYVIKENRLFCIPFAYFKDVFILKGHELRFLV